MAELWVHSRALCPCVGFAPSSSASLVILPHRLFCRRSGVLPFRQLLSLPPVLPGLFVLPLLPLHSRSRWRLDSPFVLQDQALDASRFSARALKIWGANCLSRQRPEPSGHFSCEVQVPRGGRTLTSEYGRFRASLHSPSRDLANCLSGDFSPFQVVFFVKLRGSSCARARPSRQVRVLVLWFSLAARSSLSGRALIILVIFHSRVPRCRAGGCPGR